MVIDTKIILGAQYVIRQYQKIQALVKNSDHLSDADREKLVKLSDELHEELKTLEKTEETHARKIAEHALHMADAVLKKDHDPAANEASATDLKDSVREFEVSHPNLSRIVQSICTQFGV